MSSDRKITECATHAVGMDEDCEYCKSQMNDLINIYNEYVEKNSRKAKRLHQEFGGRLDPMSLMDMRLELFLAIVFQGQEKNRAGFEITYAQKVAEALDEALKSAGMQKIASIQNHVNKIQPPR